MEGDRSLLRFLQKSKVDSDGIAFVETVFKASSPGSRWALDPVRKARQRVDDIYSEVVKEERVGALPLESLARRCIVQRHLNDLNVKFLKRVPWELGKRIWEDIINRCVS